MDKNGNGTTLHFLWHFIVLVLIAAHPFIMTSLSTVVALFMHSTLTPVSATAMTEAATMMLLWTHFLWSTAEAAEKSVMTASTTGQVISNPEWRLRLWNPGCLSLDARYFKLWYSYLIWGWAYVLLSLEAKACSSNVLHPEIVLHCVCRKVLPRKNSHHWPNCWLA